MPGPKVDPIFYPSDGAIVLRIRTDNGSEGTIELDWEQTLDLGASLIDHALAVKRHVEAEQGASVPPRGVS